MEDVKISHSFQRDAALRAIEENTFDVCIIGAGIFGACALWEATLRGLSAVLIESNDYASGVSAHSFKIVHGGIRYLQHLDLSRLRASARERSAFLRVAPHLVEPLPILVPTYGWGKLGKPVLCAGMLLYDFLTLDKNRGIADRDRQLPFFNVLSRDEVLREFPDLDPDGLTGGCVFHDGRFYNPTRLILAFIKSAVERGGFAVNYLTAEKLRIENGNATGLVATDRINGDSVSISARTVLNTAGPWAEELLSTLHDESGLTRGTYSRDACFVIRRRYESDLTLAVQGRTFDPDAVLSRPARHLFLSPWRDYTLIGVWHKVTTEDPGQVELSRDEIASFVDEVNESIPGLNLTTDEVIFANWGLVPFGENDEDSVNLSYGKRSPLYDHASEGGVGNLVTLVGLRYTMGRGESEKALDIIEKKLGRSPSRPGSDNIKLASARFDSFADLTTQILSADWPRPLSTETARHLAHSYGSDYTAVLALAKQDPELSTTIDGTPVLRAEIVYICRNEMACTLGDIFCRRTDIATGECPTPEIVDAVAEIAERELRWSGSKLESERSALGSEFPDFLNFTLSGTASTRLSEQRS